ncbi:heterokaryon incompatibility protein-domain-containing protein [Bisporella sp. PMI_857]|nr:heterokaryon incompatibility protein-domain-containing protein [Bisporella sp. PMI_857]
MAENPQNQADKLTAVLRVVRSCGGVQQTLASGALSLEEEIFLRSQLVDMLIQNYDEVGQYHYIQDAIQHLETILRRVPRDSPDRAKHLDRLSYVRMSEHVASNSRHALDEAVSNGRQAKQLGVTYDLLHHNPSVYFTILTNFGYALSQRYALTLQVTDLEEAIACAKEVYEHAPKDSKEYYMNINNLASRLRLQYRISQNLDDINEALRLIRELQSRTAPGTIEHDVAAGQLGVISADRFNQTKKLQDLDEALGYCRSGLHSLPAGHEARVPSLRQIVHLYSVRYEKTGEEADLKDLACYSEILFRAIPPGNPFQGKYLLDYMSNLQKLADISKSLDNIQSNIRQIELLLPSMPSSYPEKHRCQAVLADFYLSQYNLSQELPDLVTCVDSIHTTVDDYNRMAEEGDSSQGTIQGSWLWDLKQALQRLAEAPQDSAMRKAAEKGLSEKLHFCRESQDSALSGLKQFHLQNGPLLTVLAEAIKAGRTLSDDEIDFELTKLKEKKEATLRESQQRGVLKSNDYKTELGLRQLAMDESKNIIMDLSGLVGDILGWEADRNYTTEEFAAIHTKMEQKALDKARSGGRHPNLRLCRMCRDEAKLLQPAADSFELTAKSAWLPFGNYFQLRQRSNCSICSLILSVITTKSGALHPRLAAIDREVQGIRLSSGRLSTSEKLMRFDYGMKHVSELRVLTSRNYSQALRQAWQVDSQSPLSEILGNHNGPIYDPGGQQINRNLVKSWLNDCDNNHSSSCNHPRSGKRADTDINLTLIDVQEECLVSASSDAKYFALSYVWGQVDMSKTLKSNYDERKKPHSLATVRFPRTIRDAMIFVQSLGERYLWVDAVCLLQDDDAQMALDIPRMDVIYGQAFATIVALDGTDADAGLPGVSAGTREP